MKICRNYKTIEPVVPHIMLRTKSVIVAGLYRPPESLTGADRLFSHKTEGKLLIDTEETHGMECMITQPTRIQTSGG